MVSLDRNTPVGGYVGGWGTLYLPELVLHPSPHLLHLVHDLLQTPSCFPLNALTGVSLLQLPEHLRQVLHLLDDRKNRRSWRLVATETHA